MKNIVSLLVHYFDTFTDFKDAVLGVFSIGVLLTIGGSMFAFISSGFFDYLMLAFFGVIGQTAMHLAKIRFPHYFGRHDTKTTIGTKMLHYLIDCFLAAFFSILCAEYLIDFIFTTLAFVQNTAVVHNGEDYKRTIFGALIVGAFYETILKKAIKKNKEIDEEIDKPIKKKKNE